MTGRRLSAIFALTLAIGLALSACGSSEDVEKTATAQGGDWWRIAGSCDASAIVPVSDTNDFIFAVDEDDVLRRWIAPDTYPPPGGEEAGGVEDWLDLTEAVEATGGIDDNELPLNSDKGVPREMDLEGAAQIGDQVFWIGGHGLNKGKGEGASYRVSGKYRPNRMIFLATNVPGSATSGELSGTARDLLPALIRANANGGVDERQPWLSASAFAAWEAIPPLFGGAAWAIQPAEARFNQREDRIGPPPKAGGFNIEGLAADGNELLIGLRSPVTDGRAWVLRLANPAEIVADPTVPPQISVEARVDLGDGRGIRAMTESGDGWLLVGGPYDSPAPSFVLYDWAQVGSPPRNAPRRHVPWRHAP